MQGGETMTSHRTEVRPPGKNGSAEITFGTNQRLHVSASIAYTAVLDARGATVEHLSKLPRGHSEHLRRTHGLVYALSRLAAAPGIPALTDLGYENIGNGFRHPVRMPECGELAEQRRSAPLSEASTPSLSAPTPC
ncbi:hypothetical protein V1460_15305 [Streptomyces sp. SCSIO 30461]|uniref:hypothetical protein n=1 Tax=Streptomyces sp. SCSIO 30461 TaxID=3118085 RepID=UPI0030D61FA6